MEHNQIPEFPWMTASDAPSKKPNRERRGGAWGTWIAVLCIAVALTMILTYTLTAISVRNRYVDALQLQQNELMRYRQELEALKATMDGSDSQNDDWLAKLEFMSRLFEASSYYIDTVDREEILNAVLKAYADATGDKYAEFYTVEEYAELYAASSGNQVGIGVSVLQDTVTVQGYRYQVFQILSIFKNAPAEGSGLRLGDLVYGVKVGETYQTVEALGGYSLALNHFRGEAGTEITFVVFRPDGAGYTSHEFTITRGSYVSESVTYELAEADPTVGIVHIFEFDLTTPTQFKAAIKQLQSDGAKKFVFDVRNNPGGDLQSIKAVLSYFLQSGDLIITTIDKNGNVADNCYAEAVLHTGYYASCSVAENEVGMYRDLDAVVLCNRNTASAAEAFVATFRDYEMAPIVGETTYGKGIMQTTFSLKNMSYGLFDGYVKMTTRAYVTKCGVTYHDIGITPDVEAALSDEALEYSIYTLPQALDTQLQTALAQFD